MQLAGCPKWNLQGDTVHRNGVYPQSRQSWRASHFYRPLGRCLPWVQEQKWQMQPKIRAGPNFNPPVGFTTWSVEQKFGKAVLNGIWTNINNMAVQWMKSYWVLCLTLLFNPNCQLSPTELFGHFSLLGWEESWKRKLMDRDKDCLIGKAKATQASKTKK